ncbi:ion channel [Geoglobus acetivorans]|nr:potassium channel protein [Geoglobus acetivorans]
MRRRAILLVSLFIFTILVISVVAYHIKQMEGDEVSFVDAIYWTITTMTTVGYGDIVMKTPTGKIFSIFVQIYGIAFLFGIAFPYIVVPWAERKFLLKLPEKAELERHVAVFGFTRLTPFLVEELEKMGIDYIIVENSREKAIQAIESGYSVVYSQMDNVVETANLEKAMAIVIMWEEVEKSIDVLITVKDMSVQKLAVVSDPRYAKYLHYAGVDKVITPKSVAGVHIANILTEKQRGVLNIRKILANHGITEIMLPRKSRLAGSTVETIQNRYNVKIIAVCREGRLVFRPVRNYRIGEGSIILAFGEDRDLYRLLRDAS